MMMNGRSSFGLLLALAMLAAVAVVVFGGVRLYHRFATPRPHRTALPHTPPRAPTPSGDPALTRLRERYAAGEIDNEEYERRLSALTHWSWPRRTAPASTTPRPDVAEPRHVVGEGSAPVGAATTSTPVGPAVLVVDGPHQQGSRPTWT